MSTMQAITVTCPDCGRTNRIPVAAEGRRQAGAAPAPVLRRWGEQSITSRKVFAGVFAPRHTRWAMFLTTVDSDVCPCTVKTALDLHKAGREPSSRS